MTIGWVAFYQYYPYCGTYFQGILLLPFPQIYENVKQSPQRERPPHFLSYRHPSYRSILFSEKESTRTLLPISKMSTWHPFWREDCQVWTKLWHLMIKVCSQTMVPNLTTKSLKYDQKPAFIIILGESWSPQNHSYPEKMFPSNVLISLEAEKNPLSLIENPHKSPFRKFFYDHSKVELFLFLCSNFYKKILSITRQRKDATAVAQLTLFLNARVSYHKCHTHNKLDTFWYRFTKQVLKFIRCSVCRSCKLISKDTVNIYYRPTSLIVTLTVASSLLCFCMFVARKNQR